MSATSLGTNPKITLSKGNNLMDKHKNSVKYSSMTLNDQSSSTDYKFELLRNLGKFEKESRTMLKSDIIYIHNMIEDLIPADIKKNLNVESGTVGSKPSKNK